MKNCSFGRERNAVTGRCPKFTRKEKKAAKTLQGAARGFIERRRLRRQREMAAAAASAKPRRSGRKK
jgi:hypothetical protein